MSDRVEFDKELIYMNAQYEMAKGALMDEAKKLKDANDDYNVQITINKKAIREIQSKIDALKVQWLEKKAKVLERYADNAKSLQ